MTRESSAITNPKMNNVKPDKVRRWTFRFVLSRNEHSAFLLSSGAWYIFPDFDAVMSEYGMSNLEVLRTLTSLEAEALGMDQSIGTLERGQKAI